MDGDFLADQTQAVVVDGACPTFVPDPEYVGQVSVLELFLFLVYINDLPDSLTTISRLFTEDTVIYNRVRPAQHQAQLRGDFLSERRIAFAVLPSRVHYPPCLTK